MQKGNDSKIVKKGGALSSSLFILVSVITILLISSCSLFEKEKTDTRDPNNILDWVKVPPVGAQFAFYTLTNSSNVYYDTFSIISVDTILYNIYILQELRWKKYSNDSFLVSEIESLSSVIDTRNNSYRGNTGYTHLNAPVSEGKVFLIDNFESLHSKYVIDSLDVCVSIESMRFDSLILIGQYYFADTVPDYKYYFSSKYGMNILEIPSDTNEKYIRKLIWANY